MLDVFLDSPILLRASLLLSLRFPFIPGVESPTTKVRHFLVSRFFLVQNSMNDAERAPLLSAAPPDAPSPAIAIATLLSSLAALRAGNLPSNSQLHQIITELLNSSLLSVDGTIWTSEYGTGRIGVGKLSREGENGRVGLRGLLSSFREWIEGRNEGEVLQELVHSLRETEIRSSPF